MNDLSITIFVVPSDIAKVTHGRYVCLVRDKESERWIADDSLISLSGELSSYTLDWPFIERDLLEKNAWSLS